MYQFVFWLKALAAVLITNAHYENIYPISAIANGGLLGDVIFFAVSGYCANVCGHGFLQWYKKRLARVYLPVWIITVIYVLIRVYYVADFERLIYAFVYPTYYHFVGSILVLYIPFFFISRWVRQDAGMANRRLGRVFAGVAILYFAVFYGVYDRSYCHIDATAEPMIRFLFLMSMLVGLYFRVNSERFLTKQKFSTSVLTAVSFIGYFGMKLACSSGFIPLDFQWLSQASLLLLLVLVFRCAMGFEAALRSKESIAGKTVRFVASITLEIYVVQYAPILYLNIGDFPLNFMIVTAAIIVLAWMLHMVCGFITDLGKRKKKVVDNK